MKNKKVKLLFLFIFTSCSIRASLASDKILYHFTFRPVDGLSYTERLTKKRESFFNKKKRLDESEGISKYAIHRTKNGWDVVVKPISQTMKRNGQTINSPLAKLMMNAVVTYKLNPKGELINIEGYEKFFAILKKNIPPKIFEKLSIVLNKETMKARDTREWNNRIGDYLEKVVAVGDHFTGKSSTELPNGKILEYDVNTTFASREKCGKTTCILIEQNFSSDNTSALSQMSNDIMKKIARSPDSKDKSKQPENENLTGNISGTIKRLIDPDTMLIYVEETTRTFELEVNIPGVGATPMKTREYIKYEYQY